MPFGRPGHGEFGTYFIGYCRTPSVTELMLRNMFVGNPPGNYDRLLDVSQPVTGTLFFVPTASFLDSVTTAAPAASEKTAAASPEPPPPALSPAPSPAVAGAADTSLKIGSLKGETNE
jgi:putative iron-dependent peroxidase